MRLKLRAVPIAVMLIALCTPIQPAVAVLPTFDPATSKGIYFDGGASTSIHCAINSAFDVGLGDFTIDWWQKADETQTARWPRIFQFGQGDRNSDGLAVSEEEDGNIYFWLDGSPPRQRGGNRASAALTATPNTWTHIAVSRETDQATLITTFRIFINGVPTTTNQLPFDISNNLNAPTQDLSLYIGGADAINDGTFKGEITGFEITKRVKWTGVFTPPTDYNTTDPDRVLLIYPTSDFTSSGLTNLLDTNTTSRNIYFSGATYGNPNAAPAPDPTPSDLPSPTPTPTPGPTDSPSPSPSPTSGPTDSPSPTPSPSNSASPSPSPLPSDSFSPSPSASPSASDQPTVDPSPPPLPEAQSHVVSGGDYLNSWVKIEGLENYLAVHDIETHLSYGNGQVCTGVFVGHMIHWDDGLSLDFLLPSIEEFKARCPDYYQNENPEGYVVLQTWLLNDTGQLLDALTLGVNVPPWIDYGLNKSDPIRSQQHWAQPNDEISISTRNLGNSAILKLNILGPEFDGGGCYQLFRFRETINDPIPSSLYDESGIPRVFIPDYSVLLSGCEYVHVDVTNQNYEFDPYAVHQLEISLTDLADQSENGFTVSLLPKIQIPKPDLHPHAPSLIVEDELSLYSDWPYFLASSDPTLSNSYKAVSAVSIETTYTHHGVQTSCTTSADRLSSDNYVETYFQIAPTFDGMAIWFPGNNDAFSQICPNFGEEDEPNGTVPVMFSLWAGVNDHLRLFETTTATLVIPPAIQFREGPIIAKLGDVETFTIINKVNLHGLRLYISGSDIGDPCRIDYDYGVNPLTNPLLLNSDGSINFKVPLLGEINEKCAPYFRDPVIKYNPKVVHYFGLNYTDQNGRWQNDETIIVSASLSSSEPNPIVVIPEPIQPSAPTPTPSAQAEPQVQVPTSPQPEPNPTTPMLSEASTTPEVVSLAETPEPQIESAKVTSPATVQVVTVKKDLSWCTKLGIWIFTKSGLLRACNPQAKIAIETIACAGRDKTPTFPWVFKVQRLADKPFVSRSGEILNNAIFFFKGLSIAGVAHVDTKPCTIGSVFIPIQQSKILQQFAKLYKPIIWVQAK